MTLVPNHQPLLSGNNPFRNLSFFFFLGLLLLSSGCELFKPISTGQNTTVGRDRPRTEAPEEKPDETIGEIEAIQSRRVFDPETGKYVYVSNAPTASMDTIRWTLQGEDVATPITEEGTEVFEPETAQTGSSNNGNNNGNSYSNPSTEQLGVGENGSRLLSTYDIDFILPFLANRLTRLVEENGRNTPEIDPNSFWSLHFYSGAQMALDDLRNSNVSLNVRAHDTQASDSRTKQLMNQPEAKSAQMIIGPYLRQNVAAAAEAVRNQEIVLVSPYSAADNISNDNPNYIQVNPTLNTHMRNLLQHAVSTKKGYSIVLVGKEEYRDRLAFLQEEYKVLMNDLDVQPLQELIITDNNTDLSPYMNGRGSVFIVPEFADESFVANFLRQVYELTRMNKDRVAVYGLPQWKNFTRVDFDYYEGTNLHISSSVFIDLLDPQTRNFQRDFFARFKALPREEAYLGYDLTNYFARMISQYGTRFQYALPRSPEKLMHTEFRFEPMMLVDPNNPNNFEQSTVDHWENTFVNILQFKDYQFRKVN